MYGGVRITNKTFRTALEKSILMKFASLVFLMALYIACSEKNAAGVHEKFPVLFTKSNTDTLKFTSGIRSIFQDSKGRHWFGTLKEGCCCL